MSTVRIDRGLFEDAPGIMVLRDDLLPGGTKSIFIPEILEEGVEEYVYASPVVGGFQLALARALGDKATIFVAKRKEMHRNQREVLEYGGKIIEIPYGYLSNVTAKAKAYVAEKPEQRKLVEWGGSTHVALISERMRQVLAETGPLDEVWCAVGSGTLLEGILGAVPESTRVYGVVVGAEYTKKEGQDNLSLLKYPKPFNWECSIPSLPFPSNPNYDQKALELCLKQSRGEDKKILFWNVA